MSSVRRRVWAYLAVAVLMSTVVTVLVASVVLRHQIRDQRLNALRRTADTVSATLAETLPAGGKQDRVVRLGQGGGPRILRGPVAKQVRAGVPATGQTDGLLTVGDKQLAYVTRDTARGRVILIAPGRVRVGGTGTAVRTLILAGLLGAALALGLGLLLARRLTRPVGEVADTARRIAEGDADARAPVHGRDELAGLATAFNAMADQVQAAREREREFGLSVGHELRTPLTSIQGYAEAIADEALTVEEGLPVIREETARLERLVGDLLDLGRLERGAFSVTVRRIDLGALARDAVRRHATAAQAAHVRLEAVVAEGAVASADPGRVLQALSNLVENALRATPPGGRVSITAVPGRLDVRDTGTGLDPAELPHAFERFHLHDRADAGETARAARRGGSGLGLALVAELARAMGGRATVASGPDGSTFSLDLPPDNPITPQEEPCTTDAPSQQA